MEERLNLRSTERRSRLYRRELLPPPGYGFEFKPYSIADSAAGINEAISSSLTPRNGCANTSEVTRRNRPIAITKWNGTNICHVKTGRDEGDVKLRERISLT